MADQIPIIDIDTVKVGDVLTFRVGHEQDGIVNGDELVVGKIDHSSGNCAVYVYSPEGKGDNPYVRGEKGEGYGFYLWQYEYLDDGTICYKCANACRMNVQECGMFEERGQ